MKIKKILSLLLAFALALSNPAMAAWDKTLAGSDNISDLDTYLTANNTALEGILSGLSSIGTAANLKIVRTSTTVVTVTADQLFLKSDTTISARETSVSEAIAITTEGVSGRRTGLVEASDTWYYIVIMRKSSDGTVNGLLETSTTPTLETGYDQYAVVGAVRNNSSSDFVDFIQVGRIYAYTAGINVFQGSGTSALSNINTGQVGASSAGTNKISAGYEGQYAYQFSLLTADTIYYGTSTTTWTAIDVSSACPNLLSTHIWGSSFSSGSNQYVYVQGFIINKP